MRSNLKARWVGICVGVTVLMVSACGGGDQGSSSGDTVRFGGIRSLTVSALAAAEAKGYFTEQGIKYEPTWGNSGPAVLQGVVSGDFDVAAAAPAAFYAAIKNGSCIKVLRPMEASEYNIIAQPKLHLDASQPYPAVMKQLKGKVIGVPQRGGGPEAVVKKFMKDAELNPATDATFVAIGVGGSAVTAFSTGKVDATLSYAQFETGLGRNGTKFDVLLPLLGRTDGPLANFYQAAAIANCDFVEKHPDTVTKFCKALNKGYQALADDPEAGPQSLVAVQVASDLDAAKSLWPKYKAPLLNVPALNEQNWKLQGEFAPPGSTPDFAKYAVTDCPTA